jgi:hypothetical protein
MNHLMWLASLAGLISTAVIFGTDMFFLTVGRPALKLAPQSTATELMGFIHLFETGVCRSGASWRCFRIFLILVSRSWHRAFYLLSLSMLILFVFIYDRFAKPINRLQTEAAKKGTRLDNARVLQGSWDRLLVMRVPLLAVSMFAQFVALLATSA